MVIVSQAVHDSPETLEQFMIINGTQLTGEIGAPDRILHATDRALHLWGIGDRGPARSRSRCVQHLVEVGLLTRSGSICQC